MELAKRAVALFGVERGEERSASLMLVHAFFMGLSTVFFETAASALFLTHFSAGAIPLAYIAAAGVTTLTGLVYARLERRVPFWSLMSGTLLFLFLAVLAFRAAISFTTAAMVVFGIFIWYRMLSMLTDLEYWAVASRLYDVRQSKRLFGFIGSGEVIARMAGSFAIPLIVAAIGTRNLLVLSDISLLSCVGIVGVLRPETEPHIRRNRGDESAKRTLRGLLGDTYVRAILAVVVLGVLGKYFVDFSFLQQMQSRFADTNRLAAFFGLFSGITQAINLLIRFFVSGRVLQRFGLRGGLQTLPSMHLLCTFALIAAATLHHSSAWLFWIVVANQGIYKTLKQPIDTSSTKVLYQPLGRETRLAVQVFNELVATPLAIGAAGGVMLLFTRVISFNAVTFGVVMVITFAIWLLASRRVSREYVVALRRALHRRAVDIDLFTSIDAASLSAIRSHVTSPHAEEAIYALTLLERAGDQDFEQLLLQASFHPSPMVRRFAVEKLGALRSPSSEPRLIELVRSDDADVAAAALLALHSADEARRVLNGAEGELLEAAILVLLTTDGDLVRNRLHELADSSDPAARALACATIERAGDSSFNSIVEQLTSDPKLEVRRAAMRACSAVSPQPFDLALRHLGTRGMTTVASSILVEGGDKAIDAIADALDGTRDVPMTQRLLRICGRIGSSRAKELLVRRLRHSDERIREQALSSLVLAGHHPDAREQGQIETMMRADAAEAKEELSLMHALPEQSQEFALLRCALAAEVDRARQRVMYAMSLLGDTETIADARRELAVGSREKRAYAAELLETSIPPSLRRDVLPLFRSESLAKSHLDSASILTRILSAPSFMPWTKACAAQLMERKMNTTIEEVMLLKTVDIFSRTPDDVLAQLVPELETIEVSAGELIIRKGEAGDSLYIIVSGEVRVHDGDHTIARLGEREIVGELAVLDPEPRSASATAETDVKLLRLDRDDLFDLLPDHIEIAQGIFHALCRRIRTSSVTK